MEVIGYILIEDLAYNSDFNLDEPAVVKYFK